MRGKWSGLARALALTGVLAASAAAAAAAAAQEQGTEDEWTPRDVQKAVWLDPAEEMELALSAAPEAVAAGATVYVLGDWGYEEARKGDNGFSCYVDRGMNGQSVIPTCHDWGGSVSAFKVASLREKLRSQGKTSEEILAAVGQGFVSGELRTPRVGAFTYMLSSEGYRHNPEGENWALRPRVKVAAPYATHAALGFGEEAGQQARWSGLPHVDWAGGPMTSIVIPMDEWAETQKAAEETASRNDGSDQR